MNRITARIDRMKERRRTGCRGARGYCIDQSLALSCPSLPSSCPSCSDLTDHYPLELLDGLIHRHDVLRRHGRLDVVHLAEHEAAAGGEVIAAPPHLVPDLLRRPALQHRLRVAAAAPERQVAPELPLELGAVHVRRRHLHRVDGVDAHLDQVGDDVVDRAAGVQQQGLAAEVLDQLPQARVVGLDHLAVRAPAIAAGRSACPGRRSPG